MTIGIVCAGRHAGLAAFRGLATAERVATGSIGGFAAFAAIDAEGRVYEAATQRGGSTTLFIAGETTGVPPPEPIAGARLAGLISSGPERPEPPSQFLAVDGAVGLVSGHRLPNAIGADGQPHNVAVLTAMRTGDPPADAVSAYLAANPQADVGLIAVDLAGRLFAANSERVGRRSDLGAARLDRPEAGAAVAVLHNAIGPGPSIAQLAAEAAMAVMAPALADATFTVVAGIPVRAGPAATVEIDADSRARAVVTMDPKLLESSANGAAIYLGAEVRQNGRLLGHVAEEPNCQLKDGRLVSMSGQEHLEIGYRKVG